MHIQADPSGSDVWIGFIGNNGGATPVFDSTYYPIFIHSTDGGNTWGEPIAVTLDGTIGLPAILNYISDARLATIYSPNTPPSRDQIAYTTAFDCDITVDKWKNPHMIVGVGIPGGGFSIISPDGANSPKFDSTMATFDIYSTDGGAHWCARMVGINKRFRGLFPNSSYPEDLRVNISRNQAGDKIFYTYLDTWVTSATDNSSPDIFARGWDLVTNKLTNNSGQDASTNATYLSDVTQNAVCGDQAQQVFSTSNGWIIPMVCEACTGNDISQSVTFKYVTNFSYTQNDFTIAGKGAPWATTCDFPVGIQETVSAPALTASVYPNPVKGVSTMKVSVPENGPVTIVVSNLVGQQVMNFNKNLTSGVNSFSLDATQLTSGVYFYTVKQGTQKVSGKIIVE